MAKKSDKTATYETQDARPERPFFFSTIGGGITVHAKNQAEANEKAAKLKKNFEEHGAPLSPEEAKANSKKEEPKETSDE